MGPGFLLQEPFFLTPYLQVFFLVDFFLPEVFFLVDFFLPEVFFFVEDFLDDDFLENQGPSYILYSYEGTWSNGKKNGPQPICLK